MKNKFEHYKKQSFYFIEPHARWVDDGDIHLEPIVERVYGKKYDSLRGYQQTNDSAVNDTKYVLYIASSYLDLLHEFDDNSSLYLGYDPVKKESVFRENITPLEYWLSIKVDPDDPNAIANPYSGQDLYGAVFESSFYAERSYTLPMDILLADLIRRGELPMGDYIFNHWW